MTATRSNIPTPEIVATSTLQLRRAWRRCLLAVTLAAIAACGQSDTAIRAMQSLSSTANADSMGAAPTAVQTFAMNGPDELSESSATIMTPSQPDIVFTVNDSGNNAVLFALDTVGNLRGRWVVTEATNVDWEAASRGPCTRNGMSAVLPPATSCLFLGDVGDNSAARAVVTLYQVEEPTVPQSLAEGSIPAEKLVFRYSDGAHDVEAMYLGVDGTTYLITKRALKGASGALRPALVFAVPATAWAQRDTATATLVDSLPIVPGSSILRNISDASLSFDAQYLAVRTYGQVYVFATDTTTGRVLHDLAPAVCNIEKVESQHGEGVSWFGTTRQLLVSSEGRNAPMHRITCPLPQR